MTIVVTKSLLLSLTSPTIMANIPPEIWFHIAEFIPNKHLHDLLAVNRIFFDIAMDIRYREVLIETRTLQKSMKTLKRLRCISFILPLR